MHELTDCGGSWYPVPLWDGCAMIDPDEWCGVEWAMTRRKRSGHMSRRDFLGVAGMAAVGGGISCIGSVLGYLVLDRLSSPRRAGALPPTPDPNRAARIKQIDRPYITPRAEWGAREPNHDAENVKGFYSADNPEGWREYTGDLRLIYRTPRPRKRSSSLFRPPRRCGGVGWPGRSPWL